jgi:FkbM family methyltransferase
MKSLLRHNLRAVSLRFPQLRRYSGKLGLGRWLAPNSTREQICLDGDVVIELDLSIPMMRYLYFHHDLSSKLEVVLIQHLLTVTDIFVDVGAHIGYFALVAAKYVKHVYAFEPSLNTYAYLERNLQLNPKLFAKITPYNIGLSNRKGSAQLYFAPKQPDIASLQPIEKDDFVIESILLDTIDNLIPAPVSFLKIDVEGAELDVLDGARETIQRSQPLILCELIEKFQQRFGHSGQDIINFFDEYHYKAYEVRENELSKGKVLIKPLKLTELSPTIGSNALFIPASRTDEILACLEK